LFVVNIKKRKFWGYMIILVTISMLLLTPTAFRGIISFVFTAANVFRTFGSFAVGTFVYFFAKKIPIKYQYFGVLLILCIGFYPLHTSLFYPYLFNTAIMYGILCLAYAPALTKIKLKNDYSYGIYLYGYLVQQTIAYFFTLTAYQSMLLAFPITIACGMLSWHLIEKRCLDFGKSLSKKI
jgi:peptidoglycan/LPS O-acetylase OafA/YrhL